MTKNKINLSESTALQGLPFEDIETDNETPELHWLLQAIINGDSLAAYEDKFKNLDLEEVEDNIGINLLTWLITTNFKARENFRPFKDLKIKEILNKIFNDYRPDITEKNKLNGHNFLESISNVTHPIILLIILQNIYKSNYNIRDLKEIFQNVDIEEKFKLLEETVNLYELRRNILDDIKYAIGIIQRNISFYNQLCQIFESGKIDNLKQIFDSELGQTLITKTDYNLDNNGGQLLHIIAEVKVPKEKIAEFFYYINNFTSTDLTKENKDGKNFLEIAYDSKNYDQVKFYLEYIATKLHANKQKNILLKDEAKNARSIFECLFDAKKSSKYHRNAVLNEVVVNRMERGRGLPNARLIANRIKFLQEQEKEIIQFIKETKFTIAMSALFNIIRASTRGFFAKFPKEIEEYVGGELAKEYIAALKNDIFLQGGIQADKKFLSEQSQQLLENALGLGEVCRESGFSYARPQVPMITKILNSEREKKVPADLNNKQTPNAIISDQGFIAAVNERRAQQAMRAQSNIPEPGSR